MSVESIRVLLVDDHPVVRKGIRTELGGVGDITLVAEASSGEESLRLVEELAPDLVLLDMSLPDIDGVEVTYRLQKRHPATRVLVFSGYVEDAFVFGALEAGAVGYLLKDEILERVVDAIRTAMKGEIVFSEQVARRLAQRASRNSRAMPAPLTERESQVVRLVAMFRTNEEIAVELGLAPKTIEYHLANILTKLGKKSRREVARWAWANEEMVISPSSTDV